MWYDLPQEFIDKAIMSFCNRLRSCVAAAGGHPEHRVCKYCGAKFNLLFVNILNAQLHVHLKTCELYSLNCCISVEPYQLFQLSIKFGGYVV